MTGTFPVRYLLACAIMAALAAPATAQQRVSLDDARVLAADLITQNQPAAARDIALGLLQANPRDVEALILVSRAERLLGNTARAVDAGQAAWAYAQTGAEKFVAASVVAQAHSSAAQYSRAQFWLRRAAQYAPNAQMAALAERDYGVLRRANPLSVNLSFGANPTDNVNGGNSNDTITFAYLPGIFATIPWEVPADDLPLSGVEVTGQVQLRYRIAETATSRTTAELALYGQTYIMSDAAQAAAPEVTGASLSYAQALIGLTHNWTPDGSRNPYSLDLAYTQAVYGDDPYTRDVSVSFGRQFRQDTGDTWALSTALNRTTYLADGSSTDGMQVRGTWGHTRANDDGVTLGLRLARVLSDRADQGYGAIGVQVGYDFGTVAPGLDLSVSASAEARTYDLSAYDPAGRSDLRTSAQISLGLQEVEFYGFQPVLTLQANQTASSVPYFETDTLKLGFSIRSSF